MVFVNRISPWVVRVELWGHTLGVRWYGLAYVFGLAFAFLWFRRAARQARVPGLTTVAAEGLVFGLVAGVLLGARLGYVVQHPGEMLRDPLFAIRVWEGGMTFFGGLAGVVIALWWTARRHGISLLALGDEATVPAALGLAVGRVANFVNGELVGRPTGDGWGVVFPGVDMVPRHPSQLYEAASHLVLAGLVLMVRWRGASWVRERPGRLSGLWLLLYGLFRFATDFYRADEDYIGLLSTGQWASLAVALAGGVMLAVLRPATASAGPPDLAEGSDG